MENPANTTRADDVYQILKLEIRSNVLHAGYHAREPELALRMGVSRTTIREALIRLEGEGLVELIPRRGALILPLKAADMGEIYDVLTTVEPDIAGRLATENLSAAKLEPMSIIVDRMEMALKREDLDAWAAADDEFHLELFNLHGNRRLRGFIIALNDQVHRARMITLRLRELPVQSNREHQLILRHIQEGDAESARSAALGHRQRAAKELLQILEKSGIGQL